MFHSFSPQIYYIFIILFNRSSIISIEILLNNIVTIEYHYSIILYGNVFFFFFFSLLSISHILYLTSETFIRSLKRYFLCTYKRKKKNPTEYGLQ